MDIHIWYTLLSALVGGIKGARARLGEVRSRIADMFLISCEKALFYRYLDSD